ncbi:related to TNA1-high affinity nicotinic acid plasma membrane permease [Ustilago bromivora]|uniref:Related to TNA1-high affinity nicotinic acid plasma membrane permease n=1 Tax=Ustilago bromivora TaxID=307758 RepID=A0A1K0HC29_9BASI|nr:related to TNA1-high affinity nicotinic acid plasma membrane permease [Ustilago bromivora]
MMVVKRKKNNLSRWYKKDELVFRLGLYLVTAPSAGAFRGLLASGILKIPHIGEVKSWETIFLIEGLITIVVAIIGYFTLTDSIHTAPWLTDVEKAFLQARLNYELVGQKELVDKTHKKLIWKGIASTTSLCCAMMFLLDNIAVQGAAVFLPTVVRGIFPAPRYTIIQQQLLTVPPNVAGAIATLAFAYCSAKFKIRSVFAISGAITMCIGYTMFLSSKNLYVRYAASFFATSGAFTQGALLPASAAVNANNDSERTGAIAVTVSPCPVAMLASICRRVSEA